MTCRYIFLFIVESALIVVYLLMYFRSAGLRSRMLALVSHAQVNPNRQTGFGGRISIQTF